MGFSGGNSVVSLAKRGVVVNLDLKLWGLNEVKEGLRKEASCGC